MMKKKYLAGIACLAVLLTMLLAACGSAGSGTAAQPSDPENGTAAQPSDPADGTAAQPSDPEDGAETQPPAAADDTESQPSANDTETPAASADSGETAFTPGTWRSDGGQYYFFDEGGTTGRTASLEDGTGVGFTYSVAGTEAAFSMGAADNSSACTVRRDGDTVTLEWADGTVEHLTYVSDQGSDTFRFYTNQELADMALAFYREQSGGQTAGSLEAAAQTNDDGSVSIQVYENLGDHNSTAAWYTVDRLTAAGTDGSGSSVELAG